MTTERIWNEFKIKLKNDSLVPDDFGEELREIEFSVLSGEKAKSLREALLNAENVRFYKSEQEKKHIVFVDVGAGFRIDFIINENKWQILFIEGITIPIDKIDCLPYNDFPPIKDHAENWIREEARITGLVRNYNFIKDNFGIAKALEYCHDGAGKFIAAKSWIPFFSDKKAFIVFISWWDNRIYGENVSIEKFSDDECIIKYIEPIWFRMYDVCGHLKFQIPFDEYKRLFEHIWQDRAKCSGWDISFIYENNSLILKFGCTK